MHFELAFPSEFLKACDLQGKNAKVTVSKVEVESLRGTDGTTKKKLTISFEGKEKRLVLCKTNARAIAGKIGSPETNNWIGQEITLFPTTCQAFGETKECIRIK